MQGGGNKAFSFGKSRAKLFNMDKPSHLRGRGRLRRGEGRTAGDHRVPALAQKFQRLGGRMPEGRACSSGPPGTGKTLLAAPSPARRACRSSACRLGLRRDVRGRRRQPRARPVRAGQEERPVHHLHRRDRRRRAPAAVPVSAAATTSGNRRLNQLLVEMDGFESTEGVILLAATQPARRAGSRRCCGRAASTGRSSSTRRT